MINGWGARRAPVKWMRIGRELATIQAHAGIIWNVSFSPAGGRLASASWDGSAKVWDPGNLGVLGRKEAQNAQISGIFPFPHMGEGVRG